LRIWDIYTGSDFFLPGSRDKRIPGPDPHKRISVFLTLENLSEIFIPNPDFVSILDPGTSGKKSPDPGSGSRRNMQPNTLKRRGYKGKIYVQNTRKKHVESETIWIRIRKNTFWIDNHAFK
jgi:hypothetical protein